jgi:hypothetical protein
VRTLNTHDGGEAQQVALPTLAVSATMRPMRVSRRWRRVGGIVYFVLMTLVTAAVILFFIYGIVALIGV